MKEKNTNMDINLESREWKKNDRDGAGRQFVFAGFTSTKQILELRIFDMLNILGIDRIRAEMMMFALYRFFKENRIMDEALHDRLTDQHFDFRGWHKKHHEAAKVKVQDIILADSINLYAMEDIFEWVVEEFWHSPEYNSREYRYFSYNDLAHEMGWEE